MEPERLRALVIDDDEIFRTRLCRAFQLRGWECLGAECGDAALLAVRESPIGLAIVDLRLANESGLEIVRRLRAADGALAIIMLTGYGSIATAVEAVKCGADHYLCKPVDVEQILAAWRTLRSGPKENPPPAAAAPSLARVEWEHIQRVLSDCGGNISQAAKLLGMHRRSLQRKLNTNPPRQ